ncbi:M48 family metalloprotease [Nisaea acidiphila]|uniref:M48 family metalloprotease n=1 Tax=Nisaea acidiphila TaxID=1862145 RepID=A0A9J7AWI1_9PROT|nr:M48 family metalloprotease [Nisaea acidiphila]UUX51154.1 M48 family metalloprotease [Nisaea acidiphila]
MATVIEVIHGRTIRPASLIALLCAILSTGTLLSGCSTNPATGEQSFTAFMSPEDELRVGREQDPKIRQQFGGAYDELPELTAYVTRIGKRLAATSEMPDLDFKFTVLDTPDVNAFALPGGYVYVTRGLIALAENEAELAGVIAHEIGHVTARHSAERYSRAVATNLGATLLGILADSRAVADIASQGATLYLQSYSRDQEFQADTLGVRYLNRAGYDTGAMASFLSKMGEASRLQAQMSGSDHDPDAINLLATHPRTVDRVKQALAAAAVQQLANPVTNKDVFLDQVDGLMFGDDPKEGTIRGKEFLHKDLNFRFEVPAGFRLFNKPTQVLAADQQGARIVFDQAPKGTSVPPVDYIRAQWAKGHNVRDLESIDVNGMVGATGWLPVTARDRSSYVLRLVAVRFDSRTVYRMQFLIPSQRTQALNEDLRRTTYSLRPLSEEERKSIRPFEVRVVTVDGGDTEQSLAASIPMPGYETRFFRVINGLERDVSPNAGTRVKTIAPR